MKRRHYYLLGLLAVAAILVSAMVLNPGSDFSGTDDAGGGCGGGCCWGRGDWRV